MFVRKVKTGSGATAVQVAERVAGRDKVVKHFGSAHNDDELALLVSQAREFIQGDQLALAFPVADDQALSGRLYTEGTICRLLWQVLEDAWEAYGFGGRIKDEAFKQMVLARIIRPASKLETEKILGRLGLQACSVRSYYRALQRASERDYRAQVEATCVDWAAVRGDLSLLLYDVTTLYFEAEKEDSDYDRGVRRRVGMSKERRVDPQIVVGLLVDRAGNPLRVQAYSGNQAEKKTIVPFIRQFMDDQGLADFVVVADAGMLSRENMAALNEAGLKFIVGSKQTSAPHDLASHYRWHGNAYTDGQVIDTVTPRHGNAMVNDPNYRDEPVWEEDNLRAWRAIWVFTRKRYKRDMTKLNRERGKAIDIIEGRLSPKTARFVKKTSSKTGPGLVFNETIWDRAVAVAGLKGYVTNLTATQMPAAEVIASYHDLWHVEQSFRMAKTDLAARPIFHHTEQAIEAHLTVVIAALALSRFIQKATGMTIRNLLHVLEPLKDAIIRLPDGQRITIETAIPPKATEIIQALDQAATPGKP